MLREGFFFFLEGCESVIVDLLEVLEMTIFIPVVFDQGLLLVDDELLVIELVLHELVLGLEIGFFEFQMVDLADGFLDEQVQLIFPLSEPFALLGVSGVGRAQVFRLPGLLFELDV